MSGPLVVLVGPMGVGKSTVGQLLAERLGVSYRDTDDDIVAEQGRTIAEIFVDEGESVFRVIEKAAVCGGRSVSTTASWPWAAERYWRRRHAPRSPA